MNPAKKHVYHIFAIATDRRQRIIEALKANQIAFGIHYPLPLHLQPLIVICIITRRFTKFRTAIHPVSILANVC
jgi:dTDP-4-amino-4,6-dideoxygalactose transaminase